MTPVAATTAYHFWTLNAPSRIRNSPTKPFVPGTPIEERVTTMKQRQKTGTTFASPPNSEMRRVWRRS